MTYFQSARLPSGLPVIKSAIDTLFAQVDILDTQGQPTGETRPNVDGHSIHFSSNIQGTNLAVVEVIADADVLLALTNDGRFDDAGHPTKTNADGTPHADQIIYNNLEQTNDSTEVQDKNKVQKKLTRVINQIASNEATITRKDGYRQNREAKRVALVALRSKLQDIRDGTFTGVVADVVATFESIFPNTQKFREWVNDELKVSTKQQIIDGINNATKPQINRLIRAENGINTRRDNHVANKNRLIIEIAELNLVTSGVVVDGQNLNQRQAELETILGTFPS